MSDDRREHPFLRSLKRLRAAFWRRRVARGLVRATWCALLVPTLLLAGYLRSGWQVRWQNWLLPTLAVGVLTALWSLRPIKLTSMVRGLDRRLGLRARLITAFEVSQIPSAIGFGKNPVVQRLLGESVKITITLRKRVVALNLDFWLEVQTLIAIVTLLSAMLILVALDPVIPNAAPVDLPPAWKEPKAEEIISPNPTLFPPPIAPSSQAQVLNPQQAQAGLEALADALRDQAATRSIAEAIDQGDLGNAAEGLRRLADQLGDLSSEARSELGDALQEAAENIGAEAPGLSEPLQAGSEALRNDEPREASQALEELAEALEAMGDAPQETAQTGPETSGELGDTDQRGDAADGAGSGASEGDMTGTDQPTEEERLAVEGQPLELESDSELEERVLQPAELGATAGDERTQNAPFTRQRANASIGDLGPDPLNYPWDKRDVIRRYFTP